MKTSAALYVVSFFLMLVSNNSYAFYTLPPSQLNLSKPSDIYTVVATPMNAQNVYRLSIYTQESEPEVMEMMRPLDGDIVDISIKDVDNDNEEELVVVISDSSAGRQKLHFDVFEFEGKKLSWVENFGLIGNLLASLQIRKIKN